LKYAVTGLVVTTPRCHALFWLANRFRHGYDRQENR
jgi:hypothetical protein